MSEEAAGSGFDRQNQLFYSQEPTSYFRDRLTLLGLRAARSDALAEVVGDGFVWGQLKIGGGESQELSSEEEEARLTRFVITESQVLLHHVSETLIRMFLAHAGRPQCPWLEMAALMDFKTFRAQVAELSAPLWPQGLRDDVADVFLGGTSTTEPTPGWDDAVDACVRLLRMLARHLNADSNLYNAAKHGMTLVPGEGYMGVFDEDGSAVTGSDGTQVVYLERDRVNRGEFKWFQTTRWLNPQQAVWVTTMAISQIEALWTVARWHYLDEPYEGLNLVTAEALDSAVHGFPKPGAITQFRQVIGVEKR
jgi:hypothetical protein